MKLLSFLFGLVIISGANAEEQTTAIPDETEKINYSVGYQIGSDFKYQEVEIRQDALIQGIKDAMSGDAAVMSAGEMRRTMSDLGQHVAELKRRKREEALQQYQALNLKFLEDNAKREGVITTESGLQYKIVKPGEGESPQAADTVVVNYRGKLVNGEEFDSSYKRGEPASFGVGQVIEGWTEALQMMKPGDHWQLFIPPELAYGDTGSPPSIPPQSTLIFDLQLLSIQEGKAAE